MSYGLNDAVTHRVDGREGVVVKIGFDKEYVVEWDAGGPVEWVHELTLRPATLQHGEAVNHPAHYNSDPSGVECIEVVRHRTFNVGAAMKYLWRNGLKDADAQVEDLRKSIWHIEDEIRRLENEND